MVQCAKAWTWAVVVTLFSLSYEISARIMISRVDYVTNPDYLVMKVQVNNETEGSTVDMDVKLYMDVLQGIVVGIDLDSKLDGEYTTMVGTNEELCSMDDTMIDPVVPLLNEQLEPHGNLTFVCPYYEGSYQLRRFRLSEDFMILKLFPLGEYIATMDLKHHLPNSTDKVQVFKLSFFFELS